jgi:RNA-directed DNA polymerase
MPCVSSFTSPIQELLLNIGDQRELASYLGVPDSLLSYLLRKPPPERYSSFRIPKRRSGYRVIQAPNPRLKEVQRRLASVFEDLRQPGDVAFGFARGRSIFDHAWRHHSKRWILTVDIKDFFGSIEPARVSKRLMLPPIGLNEDLAQIVADLCGDGIGLPQGAPTSPVLSNYVCESMDLELLALSEQAGCRVSRYADDICFSTDEERISKIISTIEGDEIVVGDRLRMLFERHGFSLNQSKTRLVQRSERQLVTGLLVNNGVTMPRAWKRQLRTLVHLLNERGQDGAQQVLNDWGASSFRKGNPSDIGAMVEGKRNFLAWLDEMNRARTIECIDDQC